MTRKHRFLALAAIVVATAVAGPAIAESAAAGSSKKPAKAAVTEPLLAVDHEGLYRPDLYPVPGSDLPTSAGSRAVQPPNPAPQVSAKPVDPALIAKHWISSAPWLSDSLKSWGKSVNWEVRFNGNFDRKLGDPVKADGPFREAVEQIIALYQASKNPLVLDVYEGQRIIFVSEAK